MPAGRRITFSESELTDVVEGLKLREIELETQIDEVGRAETQSNDENWRKSRMTEIVSLAKRYEMIQALRDRLNDALVDVRSFDSEADQVGAAVAESVEYLETELLDPDRADPDLRYQPKRGRRS